MKQILFIMLTLIFTSCEGLLKDETYDPIIYMGGDKWVLYDYDIIITSSISNVEIVKDDTICINSFNNTKLINGKFHMTQNFYNTPKDRRFIVGKTTWEFSGNNLCCEFKNYEYGLKPTHKPYFCDFSNNYMYTNTNRLKILNSDYGCTTNYTYELNNVGVMPPSMMTLLSPEITTDLTYDGGARDKAITIRVLLKFMR